MLFKYSKDCPMEKGLDIFFALLKVKNKESEQSLAQNKNHFRYYHYLKMEWVTFGDFEFLLN